MVGENETFESCRAISNGLYTFSWTPGKDREDPKELCEEIIAKGLLPNNKRDQTTYPGILDHFKQHK